LVADRAGTFDNAKSWSGRLAGEAASEESRLACVALTRPQKFCAVALPDSTPTDIIDQFIDAGFER
jgi:ATP-dependent exoDNAse (exonuclease V) beta subunit